MADQVTSKQLGVVEKKVDGLAASTDAGFEAVDAALEQLTQQLAEGLAEQRACTDSAFDRRRLDSTDRMARSNGLEE